MFDMPDVARVFCPPPPPNRAVVEARKAEAQQQVSRPAAKAQAGEVNGQTEADPVPPVEQARPRTLPALAVD